MEKKSRRWNYKNGRIDRSNIKQKKKKKGNHLEKITWSLDFINAQEVHFMTEYCLFKSSIYRMGEMPWEWKKKIILSYIQDKCQIKVENHRGIRLLNACCKLQSKILSKELKAQAVMFLLECQNLFPKGRSCNDPLFSMKLIIEKRSEFNLENQLAFHNYVNVFDKVKRDKLF